MRIYQRTACEALALAFILTVFAWPAAAEQKTKVTYSPDVVAKAEKILDESNLRRSGKSIQSIQASDLARALAGLTKPKRDLKLLNAEWTAAENAVKLNRQQYLNLTRQNGELSIQLARGGNDVSKHNKIVGLHNANLARKELLLEQRKLLQKNADEKRVTVNEAAAAYAETVLAIREDHDRVSQAINLALIKKDVQTALRVMNANFGVSMEQTSDTVLKPIQRRMEKIEQEIFSESIPLRVENQSLYVDVVVDGQTTAMVVDSGASLVSLPARIAEKLKISVPSDAPEIRLVMADGREISGRRITLGKVRIGNFEAENVDAAVLSSAADKADPLLGMSYLGNFKFEIDAAAKTLKMLRVEAQ